MTLMYVWPLTEERKTHFDPSKMHVFAYLFA